jgi:hypothetical protein
VQETKAIDDVEGVYSHGGITTGIYKEAGSNWYKSVTFNSENNLWEAGMIHAYYRKNTGDRYQTVFSTWTHSLWYNIMNDEFKAGRFFISRATKASVATHYDQIADDVPTFEYRDLNKGIEYIRLGSFLRMTDNGNTSKKFVKSLGNKLKGESLIIDLRDKSGGADNVSKPYWELAKKYAKKGKVYLLVNNYTTSNAEITREMIKRNKNVIVIGRSTNCVCSYGSNYGNIVTSPSGRFFNVTTDMDYKYLLKYEESGIPVDVELDLENEWLDQALELIEKSK